MNLGDVETYQAGGLWHNHVVGENPVLSSHDTKEEARSAGQKYAIEREVEHVVRYIGGQVEAVDDYR